MSISMSPFNWSNQEFKDYSAEMMQSLHDTITHLVPSDPWELPSFYDAPSLSSGTASPYTFPTPLTCPSTPVPLSPLPMRATNFDSPGSLAYANEARFYAPAPNTPGYSCYPPTPSTPASPAKRSYDALSMGTPASHFQAQRPAKRQRMIHPSVMQTLDISRTPASQTVGNRHYRPHLFPETPTRARPSVRRHSAGPQVPRPRSQPQSSPLKHEVYPSNASSRHSIPTPPRSNQKARPAPRQSRNLTFTPAPVPRTPQRRGACVPLPREDMQPSHRSPFIPNATSPHLHPDDQPPSTKLSYTLMDALSPSSASSPDTRIPADILGNVMPMGTMSGEYAAMKEKDAKPRTISTDTSSPTTSEFEETRGSGIPAPLLDNLLPVGTRVGIVTAEKSESNFSPFDFFSLDEASSIDAAAWSKCEEDVNSVVKSVVGNSPPRVAAILCAQMAIASNYPMSRKAEILKDCINVDPEEVGLAVRDMVVETDYSVRDKVDLLMPFYKSKGAATEILIAMQLPKYVARD